MTEDRDDYSVGYRKPPVQSRFRKGQSGNPKGRPKGAKNFSTVLEKELRTRISITENGKQKVVSKREAIAKRTVNNAVQGDQKSTALLISQERLQQVESTGSAGFPVITAEDRLVMDDIVRRIKESTVEPERDSGEHEPKEPTAGGEREI